MKTKTKRPNQTQLSTISYWLVTLLALGWLAFLPKALGISPVPDGGYPGFNTAEGQSALSGLTTGVANTAIGWFSLKSDTDGSFNTGVGAGTLLLDVGNQATFEGVENTAVGTAALLLNTTGSDNTALGVLALEDNDSGSANTAIGTQALQSNTTGANNTAMGSGALESNTMGSHNTATGLVALALNTTGSGNTATGITALLNNTIGNFNTADGFGALGDNGTGDGNTAIGRDALANNTAGNGNTSLGANAGSALTTGNFNIDIGVDVIGVAGESNTIRIGANLDDTQGASACHIGGIYNQLVDPATASSMAIDATGKLGTAVSSRRFKHDIKPMDKASEAILALKPVTFHYKSDARNTPCFGLIAEEVAEINPDLVVRNKNGEIWSVRYDQINAMLLNEFLKEHKRVKELNATVAKQEAAIAQQRKDFEVKVAQQQQDFRAVAAEHEKEIRALITTVKEQASQIQKVNAKLEVSEARSETVLNNP
ncbi:MAG TPA: tail fiber domain-containing protein [Candidatus Udaeobacter sp.]|nr:tail fiber domain-containing protein [Candidatus Udaeobacter sp.]